MIANETTVHKMTQKLTTVGHRLIVNNVMIMKSYLIHLKLT